MSIYDVFSISIAIFLAVLLLYFVYKAVNIATKM